MGPEWAHVAVVPFPGADLIRFLCSTRMLFPVGIMASASLLPSQAPQLVGEGTYIPAPWSWALSSRVEPLSCFFFVGVTWPLTQKLKPCASPIPILILGILASLESQELCARPFSEKYALYVFSPWFYQTSSFHPWPWTVAVGPPQPHTFFLFSLD